MKLVQTEMFGNQEFEVQVPAVARGKRKKQRIPPASNHQVDVIMGSLSPRKSGSTRTIPKIDDGLIPD
jgi:hypothetical protein